MKTNVANSKDVEPQLINILVPFLFTLLPIKGRYDIFNFKEYKGLLSTLSLKMIGHNGVIQYHLLSWWRKLANVKSLKADASSVRPSPIALTKG